MYGHRYRALGYDIARGFGRYAYFDKPACRALSHNSEQAGMRPVRCLAILSETFRRRAVTRVMPSIYCKDTVACRHTPALSPAVRYAMPTISRTAPCKWVCCLTDLRSWVALMASYKYQTHHCAMACFYVAPSALAAFIRTRLMRVALEAATRMQTAHAGCLTCS